MKIQPARPITDDEVAALRDTSPDDPIPLPDRHLPCITCGTATPTPPTRSAVEWVDFVTGTDPLGRTRTGDRVAMTRCPACARIDAQARAVVDAHPRLVAALGTARAHSAIEGVLVAPTLLGRDTSGLDRLPAPVIGMHVRSLGSIGLGLRWSLRGRAMVANLRPWAHVRPGDRARLRSAYAAVLRERVAMAGPPVPVPPPTLTADEVDGRQPVPGGCLFCGVAAVPVDAVKVARAGGPAGAGHEVWTVRRPEPHTLGGRRAPGRLVGHLCPPCDDAVEHEGLGASAMERSVMGAIGLGGKWRGDPMFDGLTGWGALYADALRRGEPAPPPNRERWAHIDLDAVTAALGGPARSAAG